MQPLAIRSGGLVHAPDCGGLGRAQLGLAASGAAAGTGGVEALAGALDDQLALELIDRAEDMEDQPTGRRGRVDLLLEDDQADAALAQLLGEGEEVLQRAHRLGQPGDDEHVALAQAGQGLASFLFPPPLPPLPPPPPSPPPPPPPPPPPLPSLPPLSGDQRLPAGLGGPLPLLWSASRHLLPRHRSRPALRGQIPPKPCIKDLPMSGVLGPGAR